jgi:hypothetical protein
MITFTGFKRIIKFLLPTEIEKLRALIGKKWRWRKRIIDELRIVEITKNRLLKENIDILEKYKSSNVSADTSRGYVVWVMWWQGEEEMPPIIRINYNSIKRNSGGHIVELISKENFKDFVEVPDFVISKVERNIISLTHLSDLLRVTFLHELGGLWLDATIYLTAPLPEEINIPYWSPKWVLGKKDKNTFPLWSALWKISTVPSLTITQCMGIWYSSKSNPIFGCLKDFWLAYWKNENKSPYYWTTEVFLIGIMYGEIPAVKRMIDDVTINNPQVFKMRHHTNLDYNEQILGELTSDTQFFYLSWKEKYEENSPETGNKTLFGFLKMKDLEAEGFVA